MPRESSADMVERLRRLQEKLGAIDTGWERDFWRPAQGRNIIRILPPVGEMELFFQLVGKHYNLPGERGLASDYCPLFTLEGDEPCPICDLVSELRKGSVQDQALAKKIGLSRGYWMNIVVRDPNEKRPGTTGEGPYVYTPGVTVIEQIRTLVNSPDYGDISDPVHGIDLYVDRGGEGRNTKYLVNARRLMDSPLHVDEAVAQAWLDKAVDLTPVLLSNNPSEDAEVAEGVFVAVLPYERLLEKYGLGPGSDVSGLLEELEVVEKEAAAAVTAQQKGALSEDKASDTAPEYRSQRRRSVGARN